MQPFVFLWRCCCGLIALLLLVMLLWEVPTAHATIVLDPIITFEGRSRQATVRVVNSSKPKPRVRTIDSPATSSIFHPGR
jgi:P pilus assembly chaperone PapD